MLTVFGVAGRRPAVHEHQPGHRACPDAALGPCIDTVVPILGDVSQPQALFAIAGLSGISILAIASALLQLVQSRMMLPIADPDNDDPNIRIQRQTMLFLPLISVVYGGFLPAGLFIYWIVATIFSIVQQYLIVGWGSMFPLFGWTPALRRSTTPRDSRSSMPPPPDPSKRAAILTDADKKIDRRARPSAAGAWPPGPPRETTLT